MVQLGQKLFLCLFIALGQVENDHAWKEVGPQKDIIGCVFMGVEKDHLFAVFAPHLKSRHVDQSLRVFTKQTTCRLFFFAYDEVYEEAFSDLFGADKGNYVEIGVVFVKREVVDEFVIELKFVGASVGGEDVEESVAGFLRMLGLVEDWVLLEGLLSGDRG